MERDYPKFYKDFSFRLTLADALKQSLPTPRMQNLCGAWIDALSDGDLKHPKYYQIDVLELLLICLRSNILVRPFLKKPEKDELFLSKIAYAYKFSDISKSILKTTFVKSMDVTQSLMSQYHAEKLCLAVLQNIPQFGAHYYYTTDRSLWNKNRPLPIGVVYAVPAFCAEKVEEANSVIN